MEGRSGINQRSLLERDSNGACIKAEAKDRYRRGGGLVTGWKIWIGLIDSLKLARQVIGW